MSKIEKALHKAASERKGGSTSGQSNASFDSTKPMEAPVYTKTLVQSTMSIELLERERLLGGTNEEELRDCINLLRTQVLQKTRSMGWTTILVTSPNPQAGKTTIAANLALSIARELNHTALLVETCLQKPTISERLGLETISGLSDYLLHQVPIENALVNPGVEKLVVLPAGTAVNNSSELLGSVTMKKLISELKHRYADRYIILDTTHIIGVSDALILAEYADAVLLVVEDSETQKSELGKTLELLANRNVIGIVLNKVR